MVLELALIGAAVIFPDPHQPERDAALDGDLGEPGAAASAVRLLACADVIAPAKIMLGWAPVRDGAVKVKQITAARALGQRLKDQLIDLTPWGAAGRALVVRADAALRPDRDAGRTEPGGDRAMRAADLCANLAQAVSFLIQ